MKPKEKCHLPSLNPLVLVVMILTITALHHLTPTSKIVLHELYSKLYNIPIIFASYRYQVKGGIIASLIIPIIYLPLFWLRQGQSAYLHWSMLNIIMYIVIGVISGLLFKEREKKLEHISKLEEQIVRSEKLSAVGQLAAGVIHEIRNPLAIIKTIVQSDLQDIKDQDLHKGATIIQEEITRVNSVLTELLEFAKPGQMTKEDIDARTIIDEILILLKATTKKKNININYEVPLNEIIFTGNINKLKQAFMNIILNAIDAIDTNGQIDIEINKDNDNISFTIKDNGIGLNDEIKEKIFTPFFTTKDNGVGLGLSISYRIIEEHDGDIEINSTPGKGTEFIIKIPYTKG